MKPNDGKQNRIEFPPDYTPDALTWYIYRHFAQLLTDEERAVERVRVSHCKQFAYKWDEPKIADFFGVKAIYAKYPQLAQRIEADGFAKVMRVAADRVLRDNPNKKILHCCPKCDELCLTPRAKHCLTCGHSWNLDVTSR